MAHTAGIIALEPETVLAFDAYIRTADNHIEDGLRRATSLLVPETMRTKLGRVLAGEVVAQPWGGNEPVAVLHGLIHDWVGAAFVPNAATLDVLSVVQDYDEHKNIYQPDVIDSKLIGRHGDDFKIYLRLLKKKIVTVVLDTEHEVHYEWNRSSCFCRSRSTRISEVQNAGKTKETILATDAGHGFLWRLCSFWTFENTDNGTLIVCRAISLTRDIPLALSWVIRPMVRSLPKESLIATLSATRRGVRQQCDY